MNRALIDQEPLAVFKGRVIYTGLRDVVFEFMPTIPFSIDYNCYFEYKKCCPEPAPIVFQNMILKLFVWQNDKLHRFEAMMNEDRFNFEEFPEFESPLTIYVYRPECLITKEINKIISMSPEQRRIYLEQKNKERMANDQTDWVEQILEREPSKIEEIEPEDPSPDWVNQLISDCEDNLRAQNTNEINEVTD